MKLSVVMPCLNEAETLAVCVDKARKGIAAAGIPGEILVADNGSTDGSQEIARAHGARVVDVTAKGYGNALRGGIAAATGEWIVMGDADDSYDFSDLAPFVEKLKGGADLVMGNRFLGGIRPGAMPLKHRYLGNPVLTGIGRLFFHAPVGDFHCGLRAFRKDSYEAMDLRTTGMEFASEMVIKATLKGMALAEVPTVLYKDGRSRPPHLRSWRDGWRHLRFMLLFSPRWLFLYPGLALLALGLALGLWLVPGPRHVAGLELDIHTLLVGGFLVLLGHLLVVFAVFTKAFAVNEGFHPPDPAFEKALAAVNLERGLVAGALIALGGLVLLGAAVLGWRRAGFGSLDPRTTMRELIPAVVLLVLGLQTAFASFFLSILGIRHTTAARENPTTQQPNNPSLTPGSKVLPSSTWDSR